MLASLLSPYASTVLCGTPLTRHFSISAPFRAGCKFDNVRRLVELSSAVQRSANKGGSPMVKETVAGFVAVVFALGMTTAVYAQTPVPKAEEKKPAETMEKKTDK